MALILTFDQAMVHAKYAMFPTLSTERSDEVTLSTERLIACAAVDQRIVGYIRGNAKINGPALLAPQLFVEKFSMDGCHVRSPPFIRREHI